MRSINASGARQSPSARAFSYGSNHFSGRFLDPLARIVRKPRGPLTPLGRPAPEGPHEPIAFTGRRGGEPARRSSRDGLFLACSELRLLCVPRFCFGTLGRILVGEPRQRRNRKSRSGNRARQPLPGQKRWTCRRSPSARSLTRSSSPAVPRRGRDKCAGLRPALPDRRSCAAGDWERSVPACLHAR